MINIAQYFTEEKKGAHLKGVIALLNRKFLHTADIYKIKPKYFFEKRFYKALLVNREFLKQIILATHEEIEYFELSMFYKEHRLFFLLCLPSELRMIEPFCTHLTLESKSLPRELRGKCIEEVSSEVRDTCKKVFDYSSFSKISRAKVYNREHWNAYNYLNEFMPKACPYCNIQLITTLEKCIEEDGLHYEMRPALDHFLSKNKFPFFALTTSNLIPSCKECNTDLKLEKNFKDPNHINPMGQSFEGNANFDIQLKDNSNILQVIDSIYNFGEVDANNVKILFDTTDSASMQNIRDFNLENRYNNHIENVRFFLEKLPKVAKEKIKSYQELFEIDDFETALQRFIDHSLNPEDHKDVIFSIFKRDLISKYCDI